MHGYLTFHSNAHAVVACLVFSGALGRVAPWLGHSAAAVVCVHCGVTRDLRVSTGWGNGRLWPRRWTPPK